MSAEGRIRVQDKDGKQIYVSDFFQYDPSNVQNGDDIHFAFQAKLPEDIPSGRYIYDIDLIAYANGSPHYSTYDGFIDIVSHDNYWDELAGEHKWGSPIGANGFSLPGMFRIYETVRFDDSWRGVVLSEPH